MNQHDFNVKTYVKSSSSLLHQTTPFLHQQQQGKKSSLGVCTWKKHEKTKSSSIYRGSDLFDAWSREVILFFVKTHRSTCYIGGFLLGIFSRASGWKIDPQKKHLWKNLGAASPPNKNAIPTYGTIRKRVAFSANDLRVFASCDNLRPPGGDSQRILGDRFID